MVRLRIPPSRAAFALAVALGLASAAADLRAPSTQARTPRYAEERRPAQPPGGRIAGQRRSEVMRAASRARSVRPGPLTRGLYLGVGSHSPGAIRSLQRRLTAAGFPTVVDGVFGPRTEAVVVRFQRAAGLLVDGVVGRQMMAALKGPRVRPARCSPGDDRGRCAVDGRSSRLEAAGGGDARRRPTVDSRRPATGAGRKDVPPAGRPAGTPRKPARLPGKYIVVFHRSVANVGEKTEELERDEGFRSRLRYGRALKGFAGRLSDDQVRELRADPEVAFVSPDRPVRASSQVPLVSGDSAPLGVQRIGVATSTRARQPSTARVAVLDTGIDLAHPDLEASSGKNCVGPGAAQDDHGHGTHVAGTIAARNNGVGVVGVAPGTRLDAVKVLDSTGSGTWSQVICGIDWVTGTRKDADRANDIGVANLSLGGAGVPVGRCSTTADPLHRAICASTAAGVTYVVAAGNAGRRFDDPVAPDAPAAYPEVLTVTAMSDSDGKPGGLGAAPSCRTSEGDDRYASFSNYAGSAEALAHLLAAPGVCVRSTLLGGGYGRMSGTSMAAPHVSGAVALCLGEGGESGPCEGLAPQEVISRFQADAERYSVALPTYGFSGDPTRPLAERYLGYLQFAGSAADSAAPSIVETSPTDGDAAVPTTAPVRIGFSESMDKASAEAAFSLRRAPDGAAVAGTFTWSRNTVSFQPSGALSHQTTHTVTVGTGAKDTAGDSLERAITLRFETAPEVDTTAPDSSIETGPSGTISSSSARFSFSATEAGSSFECKLDAGSWEACSSPKELTGLSEGQHSFSVRAKDAAGNTDPSEATRDFTVDTTAPDSSRATPPQHTPAPTPRPTPRATLARPDQVRTVLLGDLAAAARDLRRLKFADLVRRRGFTARGLQALLAGTFSATLTGGPGAAGANRKMILAKGLRSVSAAGRYALKAKLTRRGRSLLTSDRRVKVTLTIAFRDVAGRTTIERKSVSLRK